MHTIGTSGKLMRFLTVILLIAACGGIGFMIGKGLVLLFGGGNGQSADSTKMILYVIISFLSLIVAFLANTILHEAGHMVGGLLTGYKFLSFRIFKYTLTRDESGWHWKQFHINGTAGQCLMIPPEVERDEEIPFFWYNIGGVLVNLIIVAVSGALLLFLDLPPVPFMLCVMLAAVGLYMFVLNAIPMTPGGFPNDGKNIFVLWKHPEQRGSLSRMLNIAAEQSYGKRLCEMPEEWFVDIPLSDNPTVMQLSDRNLYQCWLYDNMRFDESRTVAEEIMGAGKHLPEIFLMETASDRLFLELVTLNRADIVAELWDRKQEQYVRGTARYMPLKHATLFAYELICRHDPVEAQKHYDEVITHMDRYSQPGEARTAIALMDYIRQETDTTLSPTGYDSHYDTVL